MRDEGKQSGWLRLALSSIGDGVIATDAEGRVTFMNRVAETLTGWPLADAAGRPLPEIFHIVNEHTREPADNPALRALREGAVVGLANHTVLIARDGTERPIDDSAAPMREGEASVGAVLVFRDVTERKRAEEDRARLAAIVDSSEDAIVSKALDGTILSWNAGARRVFGYAPEEAIGRPVTMLIPEELLHEEAAIIECLRRGERVEHYETVRVAKGRRRIDVSLSVSPIRNAAGLVVGASKIVRDVTAKKRIEAERERLAETLGLALSAADLGAWEWDPTTDRMTLSDRAAEIYGVTAGANGREWMRRLIHPDHRDRARREATRSAASRSDYDVEYPLVSGTWVAARGRGVYGPSGELVRMLGVVQDVTDRKRAEMALRESESLHRVLVDLDAATRPLSEPAGIMAASARVLAEHLGVDRCAYATVEGESVYVITGDHAVGVPSIVGRWDVGAFGAEHLRMMRAGESYVVEDAETDPRVGPEDRPAYRATDIRAVICVPLHKGGRFTAAMAVHQKEPRRWTDAEVRLVMAVVGRCWEALERATAEHALAASRARLDYAVQASGIGFWYCDLPFDVLSWDERVKAHFWLPPDAVVTIDTFYERIRPEDRGPTRNAIERSIADRSAYDVHYRTTDPASGAEKWVRAIGRTYYDQAGAPKRFDGVTLDVTEQRRAEAAVRESNDRFSIVARATNDAVWDWDMRTGAVWWNEGVTSLFGYRPEDVGKDAAWWYEHIHPDDRERVVNAIHAVIDHGGANWSDEYRFRKADGTYAAVLDRGYAIHEGAKTVRLVGAMQDVTERKRSEVRLRESEGQYRTLFESIDEGFCVAEVLFDGESAVDYRFLEVNPAFERLTGLREAVGRRMCELAPAYDKLWVETYGKVALTGTPVRFVSEARALGDRCFEVSAFRVGRPEDRRVAILFTDVTERSRAEQERERLVDQLREADRRKDDFIALLAHELRNPLVPIRNGLQVLRLAEHDPAALAGARAMMDRQLTHVVRLIDDLLDVSRISRNKMELRRERLTLSDVVANAVETARPAIDAEGHELSVTLPGSPVFLDADLTRLAQVFSNLLTNSAKYTPRGGRIWLTAERSGSGIVVSVRDSGIGIPAGSLSNVFDMFSQVDRSIERSTGGLGIGLALVKGLVEMHGGTVTAESAGEGMGSTFAVTLPALESRAAASADATGGDAEPRAARRVLVVDDNRDGADSLAMMLRLLGDEVETANDGVEAIEQAEAFRPEVVLMDVGMPRLNGLDATRRIREQPWGRAMKIVALTGWGQEGDRERSREAGCDGHLVKPVSLTDLEATLRGVGGG